MRTTTLSLEERRDIVYNQGDNITLNGERARVVGWRCDFAVVAVIPEGMKAEFAWQTVKHIIDNRGGAFQA